MSDAPGIVVPFRFDLSDLVRKSVASLYSHLITRPTGQALRLGIESQIGEIGDVCLSILDFTQVAVLDYSCADETVAKLILRYQAEDRPADAYFVARAVGEHHRETIEAVLERHGLALVVQAADGEVELLGGLPAPERAAWAAVEALGRAGVEPVAERLGVPTDAAAEALDALARRRVLVRTETPRLYVALSVLLRAG